MNPVLTFIGHGSHKLKTGDRKVLYVDPFFPGDYSEGCDLLLITHLHGDHTRTELVTKNPGCVTIMPDQALEKGGFQVGGVKITVVQAYNQNHKAEECVGYVAEMDGVKIYFAGDTSKTRDMETKLPAMGLDYAILPIDGIYNMGPREAGECAALLQVRHAIPTHNDPAVIESGTYSDKGIAEFSHPGKIVLKYGESLAL